MPRTKRYEEGLICLKQKRIFSLGTALLMLVSIILTFSSPQSSSASSTTLLTSKEILANEKKQPFDLFQNPILGDGADPWVVKHSDGYYYYTHTTGNNVTIWKSKTLTGIHSGERQVVWRSDPGAPNSGSIWAPEIHFIDGKWYIYYAASVENPDKRMFVLESEGDDPFGPYHYPEGTEDTYGQITDPTNKWAIDGTVLEHNNKLYFVWSGWEGDINVSQHLYIAPMSNPWTISGERVEISRPELDWETIGFPLINEGPQILKNDKGKTFVIYSASGSWTNDYNLGMLTFDGTDPLNPEAWEKNPTPIFKKNPDLDVYGPGHNGFVKSPDGTEDWIIYHAAKFENAGWTRSVRMQKFNWNADGTPNFGTPVGTETWLRVPSGESEGQFVPSLPGEVYQYEAEDAHVNNVRVHHNTSASQDYKVGNIDFADSYVEFTMNVPAGDYTLVSRYGNGMGEPSSHHVTVNGEANGELWYINLGWENWEDAKMDIQLNDGENTIRLSKGHLYAELDYIQLIPKASKVYKYEAEFAQLHKAETENDSLASNGQKITNMNENGGFARFEIDVKNTGTYEMKIRYANNTGSTSSHKLVMNSNPTKTIEYQNSDSWQYATVDVKLKAGKNTIMLKKHKGSAIIDYFTIEEK
nr:family 43 glycosylhydrolase [Paenibacillus bovis]